MESSKDAALNRGAWNAKEDMILSEYMRIHGEGCWRSLPQKAGLKRSGKSCRFRWLNYLRPDIKRGNISPEEVELIIRLHRLLGNRWALIAGRLPGRTDNEIKNYWNTHLSERVSNKQTLPEPRAKSKAAPQAGDHVFKSKDGYAVSSISNHGQELKSSNGAETINISKSRCHLFIEELIKDNDSEFIDFTTTDNIVESLSPSMKIPDHSFYDPPSFVDQQYPHSQRSAQNEELRMEELAACASDIELEQIFGIEDNTPQYLDKSSLQSFSLLLLESEHEWEFESCCKIERPGISS